MSQFKEMHAREAAGGDPYFGIRDLRKLPLDEAKAQMVHPGGRYLLRWQNPEVLPVPLDFVLAWPAPQQQGGGGAPTGGDSSNGDPAAVAAVAATVVIVDTSSQPAP